jgi:Zn-dependent M28 family amino/carboxypeptidase
MKLLIKISVIFIFAGVVLISCSDSGNRKSSNKKSRKNNVQISVPDFNADSTYRFVKTQVDFGPRVPNSEAHEVCANYLLDKLRDYADTAFFQSFKTRAFDGTTLNGKNIIASFNLNAKSRIFLSAHWDSRPWSDKDPDPSKHNIPVDAANDGASGVGVILEIARQMSISKPGIGVDMIFFDLEDYGNYSDNDSWALGAQYWSKNLHDPDYRAKYGILLDMVGAKGAKFYMEGYSMMYAADIVKKVWTAAGRAGYGTFFIFEKVGYIDDDHLSVNENAGIPTIDIIHLANNSSNGSFFEYWHTTKDNMDAIDKEVLKAVGQTLMTVIYEER